jgi:molybdate transport system substrate-binding protein
MTNMKFPFRPKERSRLRTLSAPAVALGVVLAMPAAALAADVLVFAAASLTDALEEIRASYERSSTDRLVVNAGASSELARQIKAGAPADVFFSADVAQMDGLEKEGLVRREDVVDVLSNSLVAIVPVDSTLTIRQPRDLLMVKHLALASPESVPVGVYSKKYFESIGLWEEIKPMLVPTADVRASLAAVEAGHAGAGMVYRTDAAISKRVRVAFEVPREQGPNIVYPLAPVARSKQKDAAAAAARYLVGPEAAAIYERFGFVVILKR